ncbi:hypothetical protein [Streptomyces sp. NRRL B-24572]|uniref:hypothetical protein n=1 Tax=Streptomyces sp. NRRL B-24572 TaxID=1962156 RepID=UPI00117EE79A
MGAPFDLGDAAQDRPAVHSELAGDGRCGAPVPVAGEDLILTARTNRSKADQDPSIWMPPLPDAHCRYVGEWTATKLRWGLAADQAEADALNVYVEACEGTVVHFAPAA